MVGQLILLLAIGVVLFFDKIISYKIYSSQDKILIGESDKIKSKFDFTRFLKSNYKVIISIIVLLFITFFFNAQAQEILGKNILVTEVAILLPFFIFYTIFSVKSMSVKIGSKKIIAREIIYFLGNFLIALIFALIHQEVIVKNYNIEKNIYDDINYKLSKIKDRQNNTYDILYDNDINDDNLKFFDLKTSNNTFWINQLKGIYQKIEINNNEGIIVNQEKTYALEVYVKRFSKVDWKENRSIENHHKNQETIYILEDFNHWNSNQTGFFKDVRTNFKDIDRKLLSYELAGKLTATEKRYYNGLLKERFSEYYDGLNKYKGYSYFHSSFSAVGNYYVDDFKKKLVGTGSLSEYEYRHGRGIKNFRKGQLSSIHYQLYYEPWAYAKYYNLDDLIFENEKEEFIEQNNLTSKIFEICYDKKDILVIENIDNLNREKANISFFYENSYKYFFFQFFLFFAYGYRIVVSMLAGIVLIINWSLKTLTK